MGIKPMQLPHTHIHTHTHTHTFHPCPNLPLSLVLHRQADSHAETLSLALCGAAVCQVLKPL